MDVVFVVLGIVAALLIAQSAYSTIIAIRDDHYSKTQRLIVIAMCWLLPLVGPTMTIAAYRSNNPTPSRKSKNDDINRPNSDYIFIPGGSNFGGDDGGGDGGGE